MANRFYVKAVWDPEASVFYASSDIPGLNVEAETIAAFIEVVQDVAIDLIAANEPALDRHSVTVHLEADLDLAVA